MIWHVKLPFNFNMTFENWKPTIFFFFFFKENIDMWKNTIKPILTTYFQIISYFSNTVKARQLANVCPQPNAKFYFLAPFSSKFSMVTRTFYCIFHFSIGQISNQANKKGHKFLLVHTILSSKVPSYKARILKDEVLQRCWQKHCWFDS